MNLLNFMKHKPNDSIFNNYNNCDNNINALGEWN